MTLTETRYMLLRIQVEAIMVEMSKCQGLYIRNTRAEHQIYSQSLYATQIQVFHPSSPRLPALLSLEDGGAKGDHGRSHGHGQ